MENNLFEELEIYVSCRNLKNMDFMSKTDAQVSLFMENN
jgi:hypothetical protein